MCVKYGTWLSIYQAFVFLKTIDISLIYVFRVDSLLGAMLLQILAQIQCIFVHLKDNIVIVSDKRKIQYIFI